jgi:uncharacterized protein
MIGTKRFSPVLIMPDKILENIIKQVLEVVIPDKIILFGSRATGKERPESDYDILIIKSGINSEKELTKKLYLHINLPVSIDIIVKTPENIEKNRKRFYSVIKEAFETGKIVYERS